MGVEEEGLEVPMLSGSVTKTLFTCPLLHLVTLTPTTAPPAKFIDVNWDLNDYNMQKFIE